MPPDWPFIVAGLLWISAWLFLTVAMIALCKAADDEDEQEGLTPPNPTVDAHDFGLPS